MRKLTLTFLLITALAFGSNAQLLWKISGNELSSPSYLFGTHHIAPIAVIDSVTGLTSVITSVDKIYGEMVMTEAMSPQSQQVMMSYAVAPKDSLLTSVLAPAQIDSLNTILRNYMGPMSSAQQFAGLKPAMLSTILALMQNQTIFPDFNPQKQLDGEIQKRGTALGKEIGGLETIQEQCDVLFGSPIRVQAENLMDLVRNDSRSGEIATKLAKAYLSGDLNTMLAIMEDQDCGGSNEWSDRLLKQRNERWIRSMAELMPKASVLIAVGAGHLPGENGLINMLRKEGYTVSPVE